MVFLKTKDSLIAFNTGSILIAPTTNVTTGVKTFQLTYNVQGFKTILATYLSQDLAEGSLNQIALLTDCNNHTNIVIDL